MTFENFELSQLANRLELQHRNPLQVELIKMVKEENPGLDKLNWLQQYCEKISDIIDGDNEEGSEIRKLARVGDYLGAAKLVKELLFGKG